MEGPLGLVEGEAVERDLVPGGGEGAVAEVFEGAVEMGEVAAPASADVEVLAVEIGVGVEGGVAGVGVLADDDDAAGVAGELHGLGDGLGRAGGFDDHVGAASGGVVADPFETVGGTR